MPDKTMPKRAMKPGDLMEKHKKNPGAAMRMMKHAHKALRHHKVSPLTGLKEGSPKDVAADAKLASSMPGLQHHKIHAMVKHAHKMTKHLHKMMGHLHEHMKKAHKAPHHKMAHHMTKAMHHLHKAAKLGTGARFANLTSKLEGKGAKNPKALAAWIGRKKYGGKKMAQLAAKGKK